MTKVLSIDIGTGTKDVLLFDTSKNIENCIKMVLPSPTTVWAKRVKRLKEDIFIYGFTVGGGPFAKALIEHVKKGFNVYMTRKTAFTIRGNLEEVKELGVNIVSSKPQNFNGAIMFIDEVNIPLLKMFIEMCGEKFDVDYIAIAVQDHGNPPKGHSARRFRFNIFRRNLSRCGDLANLSFTLKEVPSYHTRMKNALEACGNFASEGTLVMDTSLAAIVGCKCQIKDSKPSILVNIGNSHTVIAIIKGDEVCAFAEHHTRLVNNPKKLAKLIIGLTEGDISDEEVYRDGGHGAIIEKAVGFNRIKRIIVTGPNRSLIESTGLNFEYANPGGDVMMTGTVGLVEAAHRKFCFKRPNLK